MVEINRDAIDHLIQFENLIDVDVKVSLFRISRTNPRLKLLNLEHLSPEERASKLKLWAQEHRFVLIIEKGDAVFAHTHSKYAEQLQNLDELSLNGRKVTVSALSDEDAEQLSAIGEAFEQYVLEAAHFEEKEKEEETKLEKHAPEELKSRQAYVAKNRDVGDKGNTFFLIQQMVKRNLSQIFLNCMKRYEEDRRALRRQHEAEDKHYQIIRDEIDKGIKRTEIKAGEIQRQEQGRGIVIEDAKRTDRNR